MIQQPEVKIPPRAPLHKRTSWRTFALGCIWLLLVWMILLAIYVGLSLLIIFAGDVGL